MNLSRRAVYLFYQAELNELAEHQEYNLQIQAVNCFFFKHMVFDIVLPLQGWAWQTCVQQ